MCCTFQILPQTDHEIWIEEMHALTVGCKLCTKKFLSKKFVVKHLRGKHPDDVVSPFEIHYCTIDLLLGIGYTFPLEWKLRYSFSSSFLFFLSFFLNDDGNGAS